MRRAALTLVVALIGGQLPSAGQTAESPSKPERWPTGAWAESMPEAQGIDSRDLADALEFARARDLNIHSLLMIRNGVLVLDAYFYPFTRDLRHDVASVTKSVVSVLTGIAVKDGSLRDVDQTIVSVLRPGAPARSASRNANVRIRDLLSMQSGFRCGVNAGEPELRDMTASPDWIRYALDLPVTEDPATRFRYCSPNFHLLSAAITAGTGRRTLDYARERLFAPLGITDVYWPVDPQGINHGWGDLQLRPRDMAKLGLLMLRNGRWADRQVVDAAWVERSRTAAAKVSHNEDYGAGWWVSKTVPTLFEANGRGGQRISVVPGKDVVVVMTGGGFEPGDIGRYLLAAIRADTPLPDNSQGRARLAQALRSIETRPPARSVAPPGIDGVAGRVYRLEENSLRIRSFSVTFAEPEAILRLGLTDGAELVQRLGLDGVYRMSEDETGAASAGRGDWLPSGRFRIEFNRLVRINRYLFDIEFRGDDVIIFASEPTEIGTVTLRGRAVP
ncbi:MAG TPA: serine hydrolase [Vicinamibacterales bacterium]|nr:serine hydrolase [Vicinamibacterales bacterium]